VDQMLTRVAQERLYNVPQMEPVRKALLEDALKFYQHFLQQKGTDPDVRLGTGQAMWRVGNISNELGHYVRSEAAYRESIALLDKLVAEFPAEPTYRAALADSFHDLGRLRTWILDEQETAREALSRSLDLRQKLATEFPQVSEHRASMARTQRELANALWNSGRSTEAEEVVRSAIAIADQLAAAFPAVDGYRKARLGCHFRLGNLLEWSNQPQEAMSAYRQGLFILENSGKKTSDQSWDCAMLTELHLGLAHTLRDTNQPQQAEQSYRTALHAAEALAADFPSLPWNRAQLASIQIDLGRLLATDDRLKEAEQLYLRAWETLEKVNVDVPGAPSHWHNRLAESQNNLVELLKKSGRGHEVKEIDARIEATARNAVAFLEKLVADQPDMPQFRLALVSRLTQLGAAYSSAGRIKHAADVYRQAITVFDGLPPDIRVGRYWLSRKGHVLRLLAGCLRNLKELPEAARLYREAASMFERVAGMGPDAEYYLYFQADSLRQAGELLRSVQPEAAKNVHQEALEVYKKMAVLARPTTFEQRMRFIDACKHRGQLLQESGRTAEAEEAFRTAIATLEKSAERRKGGDSFDWFFAAMAHWHLGDKEEALACYDKAITSMEKNGKANEALQRFRTEAAQLLEVKEKRN